MFDILLLGLNHKTADVEVREKIAFSKEENIIILNQFMNLEQINEVILISTCNRVEVLCTTKSCSDTISGIKDIISKFKNIPVEFFEKSLYVHLNTDAIRHVFRVASSLDSMMIGEPQILGQIKEAYKISAYNKKSGVILNKLMHRTFFTAKRIRTETKIGDNAVSISYAAIELGKKIFGTLEKKKVLLIGAGEMAELAIEHLIRNKVGDIFVANRTFKRGVELAKKFNGKPILFEEIESALQEVDIIISSTGSKKFIITKSQMRPIMRKRRNKAIFFIDIAVPRDIDPLINKISNSYVYDIDDLKGIINDNLEQRNKEALKAERIIDEAVIYFNKWLKSLNVVPTIVDLKNKIQAITMAETERTLNSLNNISQDDSKAIYKMSEAIVNKIMHDPIIFLKKSVLHKTDIASVNTARQIFNLHSK